VCCPISGTSVIPIFLLHSYNIYIVETLDRLLELNTTYLLIGLFFIFFTLEQVLHRDYSFRTKGIHFLHNGLFQVVMVICNLFWASVIVLAIDWLNRHQVGLLHHVAIPFWMKLVAGVMLYDFTAYWFHRTAHRLPWLWRFHRVHHSDTAMDSSTAFRSHPIEILFWFGASDVLATALFGLDLSALGLYGLLLIPFFVLQHTSVQFPSWVDKTLGLLITTPNLHKIHHDQDQRYTDSNYADIFILWDRIFGTYRYKPVGQIKLGLVEFDEPRKQSFWYLMASPFMRIDRMPGKSSDAESAQTNAVSV